MRAALYALILAYAALFATGPAAAAEVPFNTGWQFQRIDDGSAPEQPSPTAPWSAISLPHTPRIEPRIVNDQWQGIAFYAKRFEAPAAWRGQTVMLRVEAAMNVAVVTVNGRTIASHLGGYLPFTVDLSPHLRVGSSNHILIRLDNRDNPITGPKPLKQLDFNTYGGLYRGVRLIVKPPVHLSDEMLADRVAGAGCSSPIQKQAQRARRCRLRRMSETRTDDPSGPRSPTSSTPAIARLRDLAVR